MTQQRPTNGQIFQYSFLALPLAFAGLPLYVHAPDFYTRDLGMNIGLIGIILLAVRLFDAIQDPIIGYISDKHTTKRYLIVAFGSATLLAGLGAVFLGPQASIPVSIWFAVSMLLATTGFSIVTINLNMIGGFWHDQPEQRTRISAWREAFGLVGLLIAAVLPAALQKTYPAEEAFKILLYIFGGMLVLGFIIFTRFISRISPRHIMSQTHSKKRLSFFSILKSEDRGFFLVCFLTHLAAAMPGVMVLFFIRDYLGTDSLSGLFLFLYFIAGAALMPVWVKLSKSIGKEQAWLSSMLLAVFTFIWACGLQPGDAFSYGIICVLSGMALGADLALPPSIIADRVNVRKSEAEATQYYALIAFIPKVALAIASGIAFLTLEYLGFVAGKENPPIVMQGLIILYALIPCLIKLTAAYTLWRLNKREGDYYEKFKNNHSDRRTYDVS